MKNKIGRNEPCPCGSGKKYKFCCLGKISQAEIKEMYLKQFELSKKLDKEEPCAEILAIGEKIIKSKVESDCITGTYVNMAVAKFSLFYLKNNICDLTLAKEYCLKALRLKKENQPAWKMMFTICLELKEYQEAYIALTHYKDSNICNPLSIQIIKAFQRALDTINIEDYTEETKTEINKIINELFAKYGNNAALYGILVPYYMGAGNDILKAYEMCIKCLEIYPDAATYNSLGLICLRPEINKKDESLYYFNKGLKLAKDKNLHDFIKSNQFMALMEIGDYELAEKMANDLIVDVPSNQNYSNYAELLKRQERFNEALEWGRKALFIVEDDTTLLIVADIYFKLKQYDNAIIMYEKCLNAINYNKNVYKFKDANNFNLYSIASNKSLDEILYEVLYGLISAYFFIRNFELATAYLKIAQERLPEKREWTIWSNTLPQIQISDQQYTEIKNRLDKVLEDDNKHKEYLRDWAIKLIQLQDNSTILNLDDVNDWNTFEIKMDEVLNEMTSVFKKESDIYETHKNNIELSYPNIDTKSKEFLTTAETLFEIHKNSVIDFAPIVIEYCRAVENQLRKKLNGQISSETKMLGKIIEEIRIKNIQPYINYLKDFSKINKLRRKSAHTGTLNKNDVNTIKDILFNQGLINNIT